MSDKSYDTEPTFGFFVWETLSRVCVYYSHYCLNASLRLSIHYTFTFNYITNILYIHLTIESKYIESMRACECMRNC